MLLIGVNRSPYTRRVAITDAAEVAEARAQGVEPTLVKHNLRQLDGLVSQIDAAAASAPGGADRTRSAR